MQPGYQLPPGVSVYRVYTDYLQRLHTAAVMRFKTRRGTDLFNRLSLEDRIQYILTIPAAWQSKQYGPIPVLSYFGGSC